MTQEQFRFDVQNAVKAYVQQFMQQNQVPAAMMQDALNAALLEVQPLVFSQLLAAAQQEASSAQAAVESATQTKEEDDGGSQDQS